MLNFQEQVQKDLDDVFFNIEMKEFVTVHQIAGTNRFNTIESAEIPMIVDSDLYKTRTVKDQVENITMDGLVVFVKKTEWLEKCGVIPNIYTELLLDNKRYLVESVCDELGTLEFTLTAHQG